MKTFSALLLATLTLTTLAPVAVAESGTPNAKWWAEERKCLDDCPTLPRFSGTETDEQFRERMHQTDLYNACQRRCTQEYMHKVRPPYKGFDDGSEAYFKRNE